MRTSTEKPKLEYTPEQTADIQDQIKAAQEERDHINSADRSYRERFLQLTSTYNQNIEGVTLIDKFDVEAWQKEWNAFRERHHMPVLNFEELKERAARRVAGSR
jgi:hypothetical protein